MYASGLNAVIALACFLPLAGCISGVNTREGHTASVHHEKPIERVVGVVDVFPDAETLDKGKALMSYSDCAACHKEGDRKRGPAFKAIAARYPMNSAYIEILAKRVVLGAKGTWGHVVMPPHPGISEDDAEKMVMYILSVD